MAMEEVNATEAAHLSGYSERTIRRKIASGSLPARRIAGNRFAIRISDLPTRHGPEALFQRVAALEQRVVELEQLVQVLSAEAPVAVAVNEQDGAEPQDMRATLRELLLQLGHQAERVDELFRTSDASAEWDGQRQTKKHS